MLIAALKAAAYESPLSKYYRVYTFMSDQQARSLAFERFCLVLSQVPKGKVCSYGRVAELANLGNARQTCRWLRELPRDSALPWYRIVNAQGKLADFSNANKQKKILETEGILFTAAGRIPKKYYM